MLLPRIKDVNKISQDHDLSETTKNPFHTLTKKPLGVKEHGSEVNLPPVKAMCLFGRNQDFESTTEKNQLTTTLLYGLLLAGSSQRCPWICT